MCHETFYIFKTLKLENVEGFVSVFWGPGHGPSGPGAKKRSRCHGPTGAGAKKLSWGLGPAGAGAKKLNRGLGPAGAGAKNG